MGDYLFKLCGTDEVIWIPEDSIKHATFNDHAFEITFHESDEFSCAKMTISNSIRMWLVDHHQVEGSHVLDYLRRS